MSNSPITIALTGSSSFTGLWIAQALHRAGYSVFGLFSQSENDYSGIKERRLFWFRQWGVPVFGVPVGSSAWTEWIRRRRPSFLIHHHHFMENFRSPLYDSQAAQAQVIAPLEGVALALAESDCRGVVYSGTSIEPGELGISREQATPYARSKEDAWLKLEKACRTQSLPIGKVIIANPVGPFENEDRLIPQMIQKARLQEKLVVSDPSAWVDNISVMELGAAYVAAVQGFVNGKGIVIRPKVTRCSLSSWIPWVNEELVHRRMGFQPCAVEWRGSQPSDPLAVIREQALLRERFGGDFWDFYAQYLR